MIGIYKITNKINGKSYIGQSIDIKRRWRHHRTYYQTENNILYQAIRKYGIENFTFEVIEECQPNLLDNREIYWIKYYDTYFNGYNSTMGGQGNVGAIVKLSNEQVLQIIELLKNNDKTQREIAKQFNVGEDTISEINQGKTRVQDNIIYPIRKNFYNKEKRLCPVCKKVEITYGSQMCAQCWHIKSRKVNRPNREELKELIRTKSFLELSRMFNVSDNAIRKWCNAVNLPTKKKEIKQYTDEEWQYI